MTKTMPRVLLLICFFLSFIAPPVHAADPGDLVSPAEARAVIQEIIDAAGVKATFEVRAANIPNAAAATLKGKRYILYNPAFMAAIHKVTGNRWVPISILAHEIGHHISSHTITTKVSEPGIELEADEFSGFVLRRMGASLEDAQLAMRVAASRRASSTHPARADRLTAIAAGWDKADEQLAGTSTPRRRTTVEPDEDRTATAQTATAIDERYIAYDVHFNGDPEGTYHVTVRNNLVKLSGDKLLIFGRLLSTDNADFPLALTTGKNVLLVNRKGQVISSEGRKLGYVRPHE